MAFDLVYSAGKIGYLEKKLKTVIVVVAAVAATSITSIVKV